MDPLLLALLPLAGVVLTILAGLLGAFIQRRGERARWIREQRLSAYADHLHACDIAISELSKPKEAQNLSTEFLNEARRAVATVHLLGPDSIYSAAEDFQRATFKSGEFGGVVEQYEKNRVTSRLEFILRSREALGVSRRTKRPQ